MQRKSGRAWHRSKNYLVLATTSQKQVLTAAYHSYKRCGLAGCILTKLDETAAWAKC
jgi:flagellar biosynthesis protein FlhF